MAVRGRGSLQRPVIALGTPGREEDFLWPRAYGFRNGIARIINGGASFGARRINRGRICENLAEIRQHFRQDFRGNGSSSSMIEVDRQLHRSSSTEARSSLLKLIRVRYISSGFHCSYV